jgi:hypothetical protein
MPYKNQADRRANHAKRMASEPEYRTRHNAKNKVWADANPNKVKLKNQRLYQGLSEEKMQERAVNSALWTVLNPSKIEEFNKQRKIRVLSHYSGKETPQCTWEDCTVCDLDMLSIDHIANDGQADRSTRGTGNSLYRALEKEGFPEGFQTLCHNHQWKKEILRRRELRMQREKEKRASLTNLESTVI